MPFTAMNAFPRVALRRMAACVGGCLAVLAATGDAGAAVYMKIDGVSGELMDGRFAEWSEVVGVAQRVVRSSTDPTVPPIPAAPVLGCAVSKRIDRVTPVLVEHCGNGERIPRVILVYSESPGAAALYRVVLEDVLVSSVNHSANASGGDLPMEEVSFNFAKVSWSSIDIDIGDRGEVVGGSTTQFDLATRIGEQKQRPAFRADVATGDETGALRLRCPVEKGHRYRLAMTTDLKGGWQTMLEFTATEDGVTEQTVRALPGVAFLRVEELE